MLLGTVSYSVYLIHWPVLSLLRYLGVDLAGIHGVSALLYVAVLAIVSYFAVEQPFRAISWRPSSIILLLFVLPTALLLCGTLFISDSAVSPVITEDSSLLPAPALQQRLSTSFGSSLNLSSLRMTDPWASWGTAELWDPRILGRGKDGQFEDGRFPGFAACTPYTRHICMDGCDNKVGVSGPCPCVQHAEQCWFGPASSSSKPLLLVGDSNAASYVGVLEELALVGGFRVFNHMHMGTYRSLTPALGRMSRTVGWPSLMWLHWPDSGLMGSAVGRVNHLLCHR